MAAVVNTGMDKQDMKRLLMKSKSEPVNCAIGQGSDPGFGLLLLDRVKAPRGVEKDLNKQFPEAKNTRFGTAFVDADLDAKTVLLTINKPISGMAKKLVKTLKGTGFTKVRLQFEDGSPGEDFTEEETEAVLPPSSGATPPPASAAPTPSGPEAVPAASTPDTNGAPPETAATQDAMAPGVDLSQLTRELIDLVKRIARASPALLADLKDLAVQAQSAIKQGDAATAARHIETIRETLDDAAAPSFSSADPAGPSAQNGQAAVATIEKSRLAWVMTRKKVQTEVEKLHGAISTAYKDHGVAEHLEQAFQSNVEKILGQLDHSLSAKLEDVNKAPPADRGKLVKEAQQIIGRYQAYLDSEPLIAKLDTNPFVPVAVHKTLSASLAALSQSVR